MTDQDEYEARRTKVMEQVKALLAKAEATEFEGERETFENAAATKMRRWMINEAELRATMGYTSAGAILEEIIAVEWQDGNGIERAQLIGCIGRAFGIEVVILSVMDPRALVYDNVRKSIDVRVSFNGTREAIDSVKAILPELLVQCDAAAVRSWDERLATRARAHEENMQARNLYGTYGSLVGGNPGLPERGKCPCGCGMEVPGGGYARPATTSNGLCGCGCGSPTDDPRTPDPDTRWKDPRLMSAATAYDQIRRDMGNLTQPRKGSAAERLETERKRFVKSFILGFGQRVEERLKLTHSTAETPEERDDVDRMALVLKADADRAKEAAEERYPNCTGIGEQEMDMDARRSGWADASGADLGGSRFGGGYGNRPELGA